MRHPLALDPRVVQALLQNIHDALQFTCSGGTCPHVAIAEHLARTGWVRLGHSGGGAQIASVPTVADGSVGMRRGE